MKTCLQAVERKEGISLRGLCLTQFLVEIEECTVAGLAAKVHLLDFSEPGFGSGGGQLLFSDAVWVSRLAAGEMMVERPSGAEVTAAVDALEAGDVGLRTLMAAESLRVGECDRVLVTVSVAGRPLVAFEFGGARKELRAGRAARVAVTLVGGDSVCVSASGVADAAHI